MMNTDLKVTEIGDWGIKIECEKGHNITNWDKKDILEFTYAKEMRAPKGFDISLYYCITDEELEKLVEEQEKAIEEKIKSERNV